MIPDQNVSYAHVSVRDHGNAARAGRSGVSGGTPVTPVPPRGGQAAKQRVNARRAPGGRGGAPGWRVLSRAGVGAAVAPGAVACLLGLGGGGSCAGAGGGGGGAGGCGVLSGAGVGAAVAPGAVACFLGLGWGPRW